MTPEPVRAAFAYQSRACAALGSPFMGRLMALFATRDWPEGPVQARVFGWPGDLGPRAQSVPLRLAGALHALHLQGQPRLAPVYPPHAPTEDRLWQTVCEVIASDSTFILDWLDSAPQTNEVRRSATLIPVGGLLAERFGRPIRTSELGASGGLNLHWDAYALRLGDRVFGPQSPVLTLSPDWNGPPPPTARADVVARGGVDLNPLDPQRDALRLQAYLWPDQPERLALTRAAIAAAATPVDRADAIDWLAPRLSHVPGQTHLIYSTIAWQYFPADRQAQGTRLIEAAGAQATEDQPLAWFSMENDGHEGGAALTLRLWPGDLTLGLGRADFHGRWIDWTPPDKGLY